MIQITKQQGKMMADAIKQLSPKTKKNEHKRGKKGKTLLKKKNINDLFKNHKW